MLGFLRRMKIRNTLQDQSEIKYVFKYGLNDTEYIKGFAYQEDCENFRFPQGIKLIEYYTQEKALTSFKANIEEKNLRLVSVLFDGEYIPLYQAIQALDKGKLKEVGISPEYYSRYESCLTDAVKRDKNGIFVIEGKPFIADSDTYAFKLNMKGELVNVHTLEEIEISSAEKYQALIDGNPKYSLKTRVKARD